MNKPITIRAQNEVRVGPRFGQDGQSTLCYSMTCVVIKSLVAPKGGTATRSANACIRHWRPASKQVTL